MLRLFHYFAVLFVFSSMVGCCTLHRTTPGCNGTQCDVGDACCTGCLSPLQQLMGCSSGCGEIYWDEWLSDPPDCCDPCDQCGNWIGPHGCCGARARPLNHANFWGRRHGVALTYGEAFWEGDVYPGEHVLGEQTWTEIMEAPEPAPPVRSAATRTEPTRMASAQTPVPARTTARAATARPASGHATAHPPARNVFQALLGER